MKKCAIKIVYSSSKTIKRRIQDGNLIENLRSERRGVEFVWQRNGQRHQGEECCQTHDNQPKFLTVEIKQEQRLVIWDVNVQIKEIDASGNGS